MTHNSDPTRRQLLAAAASTAATALPAAALASSQQSASTQPTTQQASTRPTMQPATPAASQAAAAQIDPADIDAAGRLIGRSYAEAEREIMRAGLGRTREFVGRLRAREIAPAVEHALLFDPLVVGQPLPQGPAIFEPPKPEPPAYDGNPETMAFATVPQLSALLHAGKVTSVELTRMYLDRLKRHDPTLLCVITLTEDLALEQAARADGELKAGRTRGPLHGIPYGAKDLLATRGIPTTYGVSPWKHQVIDEDAAVIRRLEDAGAVLLAKLSLGELAMGDVWYGGTTKNPWDPTKGSSGSSAGPCSAVASGLVGFAIGSETLGSIVSPCVVCGTCGLRPTYGRVPRTGALPLTRTMDKLGPIARGVDDLAYILHAIAGADAGDPTSRDVPFSWTGPESDGIRVGYDKHAFDALERLQNEPVKTLYADALDKCRELFGELAPVELPRDRMATPVAMTTIEVEGAESFTELTEAGGLQKLVQQALGSWPNTFRRAGLLPAVDYLRTQRVRRQLMQQAHEALGDVDVFVTAPRVGPNLVLTNLTGHPAALCRAGLIDGMPHQLEFVGRLYGEGPLLAVASRFAATVETRNAWPRDRWA